MIRLDLSRREKIIIAQVMFVAICVPFLMVKSTINKIVVDYEQVQISKLQDDLRVLDGMRRLNLSNVDVRLKAMQQAPEFKRFLQAPTSMHQTQLENFWILTEVYSTFFDSISFLSLDGHERVRVDFDLKRKKYKVIKDLADRSQYHYFKVVQKAHNEEVVIEGYNLEKQDGEYVKPYKPSYRLMQPVVLDSKRVGYLILSVDVFAIRDMFADIKSQLFFTRIVNSDGYYVLSPQPEQLFGQYIEAHKGANLKMQHPLLWKEIQSNRTGVWKSAEYIYCYLKIEKKLSSTSEFFVIIKQLDRKLIDKQALALNQNYLSVHIVAWCFGVILALATIFYYINSKRGRLDDKLARLAFNGMSAVIITDAHNRIIKANGAFTRITGYTESEVLGSDPRILSSGYHNEAFYEKMWHTIKEEGSWEGEIVNRNKLGEHYHELLSITSVKDGLGGVTNYIASFMDIGDQKKREEELRDITLRDPMTGVFNRRHFDNMLLHHSNITARYHVAKGCCIALLDIDHFKRINDAHGHSYGDEVINFFSDQLSKRLRKTDIFARVGGEEFAVIMPFTQLYQAEMLLEDIRAQIECHENYRFTVSIGVVCMSKTLLNKQAYEAADKALYYSKKNGRNQISVYDEVLGVCAVDAKGRKRKKS